MKKKKRRISRGAIFINLLPCITVIGIGGGVICKTFGAEIVDSINQWKIQNEYTSKTNTFELPELPTLDDLKEVFKTKDQPKEEIVEISEVVIDNDNEEVLIDDTEEEIVEETIETEPIIYPEYTSSELLDSGYEFLDIDFDGLKEKNEDVVGWLDFPGTSLSYPVVQGEDNEFYLHHDINGNNSYAGTIFVDSRVNLNLGDDTSTCQFNPIGFYGHNMRNKTMFKAITYYKEDGYVDKHPFAVYYSPEGVYKLEIFADQYVSGDSEEGLFTNILYDEKLYNEFVNNIIENSSFKTNTEVDYGDKIGYFITCTYEKENLRYAVWYRAVKQYTNEIDKENSVEEEKSLTLKLKRES